MLYLVATPLGNLDDLSKRALATLELCDIVLCEDTRRTSVLLDRYGLKKKLRSYHQFKEKQAIEGILADLTNGLNIALVSDAGTPCINDPGHLLVSACIEKQIPFTGIPGPCSVIQALVLSGLETDKFQFIGFLPKNCEETLKTALFYPGTTVAFESPERLCHTLEVLTRLDPLRKVAVAREMTKMFEECRRGTPAELLSHFSAHAPRGEIVLCLAKGEMPEKEFTIEETVEMLQELHGLSLKEAIQIAARIRKTPKRTVYQLMHQKKPLDDTEKS